MGDENLYRRNPGAPGHDADNSMQAEQEVRPLELPPLTPEEIEEVARQRELFMKHMPEFYPFFSSAVKLGLSAGWRSVKVTVHKKSEDDDH